VVATSGERGLVAASTLDGRRLGDVRREETLASARALGCARVEFLGYGDSGLDGNVDAGNAEDGNVEAGNTEGGNAEDRDTEGGDPQDSDGEHNDAEDGDADAGATPFASVDVEEAATALARLLREEDAILLTTYDPAGGYGHPDHVQAHRVGMRAAALAGTPVVLQATVDRDLLVRALRLIRGMTRRPVDLTGFETAYTPRRAITHRIDVRRYISAKRHSMSAHVTQSTGGESERTLAALLRLPRWLFRRALGTEWYVEPGVPPGRPLRHPLANYTRTDGPP
jgi:LmbE family N-acetylglucosaminyl deacetylase